MKVVGDVKIEDVLYEEGLLSKDQLSLVKLEGINTGKAAETIILEHGFVSQEQLTQARAKILGTPFIALGSKGISPEVLSFIPEPVARRYTLIPFEYDRGTNTLSVAMADPLDLQVIGFIEQKSQAKIRPYLAIPDDIVVAISEQYAQSLSSEVTAALKEAQPMQAKSEEAIDVSKIGEIIREAPVAKIVSTLLEYAIKARASDVHIEPLEEKTRVRYRIDGILHEKLALPRKVHEAVVSRIKILSNMKIDEKRLPQDGRFSFRSGDQEIDLRVSSLPTVHGEKIVMRLLKKSGGVPTLGDLGLRGMALKNVETAILRPHGIILITGPTGSGKTTTLYAILTKINSTKVNIVTLEDPVEYQIVGVNQVQINPQAGLTFASGLRSFLRQDPNIIMVGEVRDTETADLAIQAALTGHLVFSTLHTNSASGALPRLLDMGGEPFLIASSVNAIIAQRVVRKICLTCKESYEPPGEVVENIKNILGKLYAPSEKDSNKVLLYRGKGCAECNNTGYLGRIGVFEVLPITEKIGRLILERETAGTIEKQSIEDGMITMKQDGYMKVVEGISTIEEVLRVAQD